MKLDRKVRDLNFLEVAAVYGLSSFSTGWLTLSHEAGHRLAHQCFIWEPSTTTPQKMYSVAELWLSGAMAVMGSGRDSAMAVRQLSFTHFQYERI